MRAPRERRERVRQARQVERRPPLAAVMLIEDFVVRPRRPDWRSALRKAHGKFCDFRTCS
jgi:hypothetical protein